MQQCNSTGITMVFACDTAPYRYMSESSPAPAARPGLFFFCSSRFIYYLHIFFFPLPSPPLHVTQIQGRQAPGSSPLSPLEYAPLFYREKPTLSSLVDSHRIAPMIDMLYSSFFSTLKKKNVQLKPFGAHVISTNKRHDGAIYKAPRKSIKPYKRHYGARPRAAQLPTLQRGLTPCPSGPESFVWRADTVIGIFLFSF